MSRSRRRRGRGEREEKAKKIVSSSAGETFYSFDSNFRTCLQYSKIEEKH